MPEEIINPEKAFELKTTRQNFYADVLFLIGTLISMNRNIATEEEIVNPAVKQTSGMSMTSAANEPIGLGTLPLQFFLAATILLAITAAESVNKQKAEAGSNVDQTTANNIKGGEIVIFGQLLRIIGYIVSITGENIKTANPV